MTELWLPQLAGRCKSCRCVENETIHPKWSIDENECGETNVWCSDKPIYGGFMLFKSPPASVSFPSPTVCAAVKELHSEVTLYVRGPCVSILKIVYVGKMCHSETIFERKQDQYLKGHVKCVFIKTQLLFSPFCFLFHAQFILSWIGLGLKFA